MTSDRIQVPRHGVVRAEFLAAKGAVGQGFDLETRGGFELANGQRVPLLRTWREERFEDVVSYPYISKDGILFTWNVYEMTYGGGKVVEEKWTENAGMWLELREDKTRVYHCSHGMCKTPDFESLVYSVKVTA